MFIKTEASVSFSLRRTMMMNDNIQKLQEGKIMSIASERDVTALGSDGEGREGGTLARR